MIYEGPVVYIVHSPPSPHYLDNSDFNGKIIDKYNSHMKKIALLIKFARIHKLPVFIELINEIQYKRLIEFLGKQNLDGLNIKLISPKYQSTDGIKERFNELGISPSQFLFAGWWREKCCTTAIERLKKSYPDSELSLLRGDFNMSAKGTVKDYIPEDSLFLSSLKERYSLKPKKLEKELINRKKRLAWNRMIHY